MSLLMKTKCEKCGQALVLGGPAFICSYQCTFCSRCAEIMQSVCPNCGGELVPRPKR